MKKLKKIAPVILALSVVTGCSNKDTAEVTNDQAIVETVSTETAKTTEAEPVQEVDLFNPEPTILPEYSADENLKTFKDFANQVAFDYNDSFLAIDSSLAESNLKNEEPQAYEELLALSEAYKDVGINCFYILDENGKIDGSNFLYMNMDLGVENMGDELYTEESYTELMEGFKESLPPTSTLDTQTPIVEINGEKYIFSTIYNSENMIKQFMKQAPDGTLIVFQLTTFENTEEYDTMQFEKLMNSISYK